MRFLIVLIFTLLMSVALSQATYFCTGIIKIELSPNPANTSMEVTAFISGVSGCEGKIAYVRDKSCGGDLICNATLSANDTGSCSFISPNSEGNYTYFVCIDKDGDRIVSKSGERDYDILKVEFYPQPQFPKSPEVNITPQITGENKTIEKEQEKTFDTTPYLILGILIIIGFIITTFFMLKPREQKKKRK